MNKQGKACEGRGDFGFFLKNNQGYGENMEGEISPVFDFCNQCSRKMKCIKDKEKNIVTALIAGEANDLNYEQNKKKNDAIEFNSSQNEILKFAFNSFQATVEKVGYKFGSDNGIDITPEHNEAVLEDLKQDFFLSISQYIAANSNQASDQLLRQQVLNQIKTYIPKIRQIFEQYYLDE